ncbi:MAG: flagellar filament capping protein FliD [Syntrophotaleaceae bacterium]
MILTGDDAATTFSATVSGATTANGYAALTFSNTQPQSLASIVVDGIAITGESNTFDEAIPGVSFTVSKENALGESTSLSVEVDQGAVKSKIEGMVSAYNDIINFLDDQKDAGWGHDSGFRSAKRRLQNLLVTSVGGSGNISSLSQLGLKTQRDGTLAIDSSTLENAIATDLESIDKLLAGEEGVEGISAQFVTYLENITDSFDGLLSSRKQSSDREIRRIEQNITNTEARLEKREQTLRAQFDALETLVSAMNQQSSFLTQQLSQLSANN